MSMFHDDPTQTYQNADAMYHHISKRGSTDKIIKSELYISLTDIFERQGVDIIRPLPITRERNRYIVVAMDYFSRWLEARPLKAANTDTVAIFLYEKIICRFGAPRILQSDRGTHFVNEVIQRLTKRFRIKYSLSSPYYSQSNRLVERFNKTLCEGIAKLAEEVDQWDKFIQPVLFAYRIKELRISKQSPYMLVYERKPTLVMNYEKHGGSIMKRLLKIIEKVS